MPPEKADTEHARASLTLTQLQYQVRAARLELRALRQKLDDLRREAGGDLAAQLLEANEQLLLAALDAQVSAETAMSKLDRLEITSQRDALTDTPNRTLMLDRVESAITLAQRRCTQVAVIFVDIDRFKEINDTLGHATGDAVLQMVARRLEGGVRDSDAVGRHGGDEFLVLLSEVSKVSDAAVIVKKMIADIATPSLVDGHLVQVAVSVGIAMYPGDSLQAATLISLADAAMYRSKRRGGGTLSFYCDAPATDSPQTGSEAAPSATARAAAEPPGLGA
jgi:diguanylate cyclase (GGDEF)-like protein